MTDLLTDTVANAAMARVAGAFNETTGETYNGGNVNRLLAAAVENGYNTDRGWAGFKQWLTAGRVVRKGEHGTACLTVVHVTDKTTGRERTAPRGFRVFHYDQTSELAENGETVQV